MKYVKFGTYTGKENMQIDSDLLDEAIASGSTEPVFRLYAWNPKCISLGRNQKDDFIQGANIDCVRRLTGGRALLHDDEITYSCIMPVPDGVSVNDSYKEISGILIDFFKTLGVELDFGENKKISTKFDYCMLISTGADVCYKGKKIIGSAQYRKQGYILQHGSILFGYDKAFLEELFEEEVQGITTVKEILPDITKDEFVKKLENYILTIF
ncbi:MAG: lipoate--protein ligase family protein [Candidatus Gastranaerophilales bacterium]|nr:lipoate--protein ligase family protein [Candidatus Gastranaerophilales bacterium]MCM1073506.1 lipoate--protein ligase family protein [Bacteroides sp.]